MKKRKEMIFAAIVVLFAFIAAWVIGIAIDNIETHKMESELRTLEDSVHYYEDGM